MCGLAGFFSFRESGHVGPNVLKMLDVVSYRGPDKSKVVSLGSYAAGVSRLSIYDIANGTQPWVDEQRGLVVSFNGAIYNYRELRSALIASGYDFKTRCDTELIPVMYEVYGEDFVKKLNGMWAIAIYDVKQRRIFLSRDRFGQKPLYYTCNHDFIAYASEIKSFSSLNQMKFDIDESALSQFFYFGQSIDASTPIKDVLSVCPTQNIIFDLSGSTKNRKYYYWNLKDIKPYSDGASELPARFVATLSQAITRHNSGDIKPSFSLSGGLDSSALIALQHAQNKEVACYSMAFNRFAADESPYQLELASFLNVKRKILDFGSELKNYSVTIPRAMHHIELPLKNAITDSFLLNYFEFLSRNGERVNISGEGADEILRGYEYYGYMAEFFKYQQGVEIQELNLWGMDEDFFLEAFDNERFLVEKFGLFGCLFSEFMPWMDLVNKNPLTNWITNLLDQSINFEGFSNRSFESIKFDNLSLQNQDLSLKMPNFILTAIDRLSMAAGVEVRCPYLDDDLVNLVLGAAISIHQKDFFTNKNLLRLGLRGKLPATILKRQKQGWGVPPMIGKDKYMTELFMDMCGPASIKDFGFFNEKAVAENLHFIKSRYSENFENDLKAEFIERVFTFQLWYNCFYKDFQSNCISVGQISRIEYIELPI